MSTINPFGRSRTLPFPIEVRVKELIENRSLELNDSGIPIQRVTYSEIDPRSEEYSASIPDADEYTLENLLASGTPLEQIPCNLFNPTDPATYEDVASIIASKLPDSVAQVAQNVTPNFEPSKSTE